jgi:hypothetical protein
MDTLLQLLGYVGILFMVGSYFMLVMGHMKVTDMNFVLLNILGSLFLVLALYTGVTLPLMYVLAVWLLISVFGWLRHSTTTA